MPIKRVSGALRAAANLLEAEGWVQSAYKRDPDTATCKKQSWGHCAVGALAQVTGDLRRTEYERLDNSVGVDYEIADEPSKLYTKAVEFLATRILGDEGERPWHGIMDEVVINFNDGNGRTRQQVIDQFLDAAKEARRQERMAKAVLV